MTPESLWHALATVGAGVLIGFFRSISSIDTDLAHLPVIAWCRLVALHLFTALQEGPKLTRTQHIRLRHVCLFAIATRHHYRIQPAGRLCACNASGCSSPQSSPQLLRQKNSALHNDLSPAQLARESACQATALNMIDMIGVGPFVTIPLIIHAMHGPQAMLGWVLGAGLAMCDGLVWAELGASMPQAGGSYQYLKESYGAKKLGRLMSFLFVWQLIFSAPLSIASGCLGIARYAEYVWPSLGHVFVDHTVSLGLGFLGSA